MRPHENRPIRRMSPVAIVFAGCLCLAAPAWGQCEPAWGPVGGFGSTGSVVALAVFDDGSGPVPYAGGSFTTIGGVQANNIAKWDGTSWSPLGTGMSAGVRALTVFDDGSGPALYAGGEFSTAGGVLVNQIAKWDGTSWSPLGAGMSSSVFALTIFDDGSGPALYAGGGFTTAGGVSANRIAKWDGTSWWPLGAGISGEVIALTVFNDGSGPALYAGGFFTTAGGLTANHIAKWDGASWSPLGAGTSGAVQALAVFGEGSGPALYVGGLFTAAGGVSAKNIAKWDGTSWSPLGAGLGSGGSSHVFALVVFNDGSGPALYAGGWFTTAGGVSANHIAKWDGASWSPLGAGRTGAVQALAVFGEGSGAALYAGDWGPDIVSRWRVPVPEVTGHPADLSVSFRDPAVFSLTALSTPGPMTIQWRKDGQRLLEDPPRITGTQTTTLRIDSVVMSDAGRYDAVLTNMCGPTRTRSAILTITCYADCDQSTGVGILDIFDFLCFQNAFVRFEPYADCDGNNVLNIFDFLCFQDAFVSGCP